MYKSLKFAVLLGVTVIGTPMIYLNTANAEIPERPPRPATIEPPATGPFTFYVTSKTPGTGGDLGGLAGADAHCQSLAAAANGGERTWRAYLSTQPVNGQPAVNARDRIGSGPWYNANGDVIAMDVAELHGDVVRDRNRINQTYALDENGKTVNGLNDTDIRHNILTGPQSDGRAWSPGGYDTTCNNWTSHAVEGSATVGHHDRTGLNTSWNQVHPTLGCNQEALNYGYGGMLYCFAIG